MDEQEKQIVGTKKSGFNVWILFLVVLIITLITGGYFYLGSLKKPSSLSKTESGSASKNDEKWVRDKDVVSANITSSDTHKISDSLYRMYYMAEGGFVLAESTDAKTFNSPTQTNVTEDRGYFMSNPAVLKISDGKWVMIYEQQPMKKPGQANSPKPNGPESQRNLYLAASPDGKSFTKYGKVLDSAEKDDYFASVPDLVLLPDNSIQMFYVSGGNAIASAISIDEGKTWTRQEGYCLEDGAVDPDVARKSTGGKMDEWTMYYSNIDPGRNAIYKATSSNGKTWKSAGKVLERENEASSIVDPDVVEGVNNDLVMFFGEFAGDSTAAQGRPTLYRATLSR